MDIVRVPVPATPEPTPDMGRDLRRVVVNVQGGMGKKSVGDFLLHSQVRTSGAVSAVSAAAPTSTYRPQWILSAAEGYVLPVARSAREALGKLGGPRR